MARRSCDTCRRFTNSATPWVMTGLIFHTCLETKCPKICVPFNPAPDSSWTDWKPYSLLTFFGPGAPARVTKDKRAFFLPPAYVTKHSPKKRLSFYLRSLPKGAWKLISSGSQCYPASLKRRLQGWRLSWVQTSYLSHMQSSRVGKWKTYTQTGRLKLVVA